MLAPIAHRPGVCEHHLNFFVTKLWRQLTNEGLLFVIPEAELAGSRALQAFLARANPAEVDFFGQCPIHRVRAGEVAQLGQHDDQRVEGSLPRHFVGDPSILEVFKSEQVIDIHALLDHLRRLRIPTNVVQNR